MSKQHYQWFYLSFFLLFIGFVTIQCSSSPKQETVKTEPVSERVDSTFSFDQDKLTEYLQFLSNESEWMGGVAIMHKGEMMYMKNFGQLSSESNRQADPGTKYRIGSITKMYAAALINQLVAEGELSMSSKLSRFYPQIPNADEINIDELLGHRSGLVNYSDLPSFSFMNQYSDEEIIELIASEKPISKPGKKASYSNSNYFLLGKIIEQVTGRSFEEQLEKKLLTPRRYVRTSISEDIQVNKNESFSFVYDVDQKDWKQVETNYVLAAGAAGAIEASAGDVARFLSDLYGGELFPSKYVDNFTLVEEDGFGYGAFKIPFMERVSYGHTGGIGAYQSIASYFPKEDIAFVLLSSGLNNYSNNDIAIHCLSILFGLDVEPPSKKEAQIVENATPYLGNYASDDLPMDIRITENQSELYAQATGQSKFKLFIEGNEQFSYDVAGITITFRNLSDGLYQEFLLNQNGAEFLFKRTKD